ncbi:MAG: class I SAM-dependent methyltransferase, partial [Tsuneonella sp.]
MTEKADVHEYYDAVSEEYFQQYQRENLRSSEEYPANYFRLQLLVRLLAEANARSVFEVGVGEGTPLVTMASLGLNVVGCDIADSMVAQARQTFEKNGLSADKVQW